MAVGNGGGGAFFCAVLLVDDEAAVALVLLRRQEALMRVAAHEQLAGRVEHHVGLVHHPVAAAALIALDDRRARAHARAERDRREQEPVLAAVQVPEQVLQVPLADELVALGVVEQRRRILRLQRVVIAERVGVEVDDGLLRLVDVRAAVAPDVRGLSQQVHGRLPLCY